MSKSWDVLVLGGGIVGTAIAWQLTQSAPNLKVLLIEKNAIGSGSTSRSAAAFRHQFSSKGNIALSKVSHDIYSRFDELFGITEPLFRENGYLFAYTDSDLFEVAKSRAEFQQSLGIPVEILSGPEVDQKPSLKGFFDVDALVGATWCARDGFLDPLLVAQTFYEAAKNNGVEYCKESVEELIIEAGQVKGVRTNNQSIHANFVVNALGFAANRVLNRSELKLPYMPVKRYLYVTSEVRDVDVRGLPLIVCDLEPYMRPEAGNALLMGWDALPRVPDKTSLDTMHDFDQLEIDQDVIDADFTNDEYGLEIRARMAEIMPLMESDKLKLFQETCGYYQITSDEKPILGPDPRCKNLLHACGFSGHGVMHAPAAAQIIAGEITGENLIPDIEPGTFSLEPLLNDEARPDPEHMSI